MPESEKNSRGDMAELFRRVFDPDAPVIVRAGVRNAALADAPIAGGSIRDSARMADSAPWRPYAPEDGAGFMQPARAQRGH